MILWSPYMAAFFYAYYPGDNDSHMRAVIIAY